MNNRTTTRRRGLAILLAVVMIAAANMLIFASLAGSGADAALSVCRVDTAQAYYAAESGAIVVVKTTEASITRPTAMTSYTVGASTFTVTALPAAGTAGTVNITGADGTAARRVRLDVQ
jgi:hypothetical protein